MSRKYNARLAVMGVEENPSSNSDSGDCWRELIDDDDAWEDDENDRALMGVARGGASRVAGCCVAAVLSGIEAAISRKPKYGMSPPISQPARTQTSSISVIIKPYRQECSRMHLCKWARPFKYSTRRWGASLRIPVFQRSKLLTIPTSRPRGRPALVWSVSLV